MKTAILRLLTPLLLAVGFAAPALPQDKDAIKFFSFLCEIDLRELKLPQFQRSEFTLNSTKSCAGTASQRNAKIECEDFIPNWTFGDKFITGFVCTINGAPCGITPKVNPPDPNAPLLTAQQTQLTVDSAGKVKLTCFYKP